MLMKVLTVSNKCLRRNVFSEFLRLFKSLSLRQQKTPPIRWCFLLAWVFIERDLKGGGGGFTSNK